MKTYTLKEWREKGKEIFGTDDFKKWQFVCPMCGNIQTYDDFEGITDDPIQKFYFSCIGRFKDGVGCNWTLGGLFQIHETDVINEDGKKIPVFEFSTKKKEAHPISGFAKEG